MASRDEVDLLLVPFDGYGRDGHQARAAAVLVDAGLTTALRRAGGRVREVPVPVPDPDPARGPRNGLVNEAALERTADRVQDTIWVSTAAGRLPVLVGGDCSLLLGVVPGAREALGRLGLLFVDGHEDTMPLDVVEDGEAANCEIGLLLGTTLDRLTGPLAAELPALDRRSLVAVGMRDEAWRARFGVASLADDGVRCRPLAAVAADPAGTGADAARYLVGETGRWWLHVDLDVLDPLVFAAQGLPGFPDEPGGLTWEQLRDLLLAAVDVGGCAGVSAAIYDPDQDPSGADAARVVDLLGDVVARVLAARTC